MDPVSHALFGRTLAVALVRPPRPTGLVSALVLGSLLPDVDIALAPRAFEIYLRAHASGTHSLVGSFAGALLLAAALRGLVRESRYWPLFCASWAGTLGHIFWDLADDGDIKVLDPLSGAVFGWHLVAMGEPAVLTLLVAAVLLAWRWPLRARSAAGVALVGLGLVLTVKTISQASARARYAEAVPVKLPGSIEVVPILGSLSRWTVYDRVDDIVRAWRVDSHSRAVDFQFERSDAEASPVAAASRDLPVVRAFLGLSGMPFARIENDGAGRIVLWSDIRWCSPASCDVSFGGAFDSAMTPLYQIVQIGGLRQTRPVPTRASVTSPTATRTPSAVTYPSIFTIPPMRPTTLATASRTTLGRAALGNLKLPIAATRSALAASPASSPASADAAARPPVCESSSTSTTAGTTGSSGK